MKTLHPIALHSSVTTGTQHSSLSVTGSPLGHKSMGLADLELYYNFFNHNVCALDTAETFSHTSGPVTLGYAYNSLDLDAPWQLMVSKFNTPPSATAKDGDEAVLRTADGSLITYHFNSAMGMYLESDFGESRNTITLDKATSSWILYNPTTQQRNVFDSKGLLTDDYKDGLDVCKYAYDSKNRLTTITPPSDTKVARTYEITYTPNSTGELVSIAVKTSKKTTVLRQYQFSKSGLLLSTQVMNQATGSDSLAVPPPYEVQYTYEEVLKGTSTLKNIEQTDGSQVTFQYTSGSLALNAITIGDKESYDITHHHPTHPDEHFAFEVTDGPSQEITFDKTSAMITQIAKTVSPEISAALGTSPVETTIYGYTNNRLTTHDTPNGLTTICKREQDSSLLSYGMERSSMRGDLNTLTTYAEISGRVYKSGTTAILENGQGLINAYIHKKTSARPHFSSDCCINMLYHVSPAGQITGHDIDLQSGLPTATRQFLTLSPETRTLTEVEAWTAVETKALRFSLTTTDRIDGTTLPHTHASYLAVTADGHGDESADTNSSTRYAYDDMLNPIGSTEVKAWQKGQLPVTATTATAFNELGQQTSHTHSDIAIDESEFWLNQAVTSNPTEVTTSTAHTNALDPTGLRHSTITQPNQRTDEHAISENGWIMSTKSTDPSTKETRSTNTVYTDSGQPWKLTSKTGQVSFHYYDFLDRLVYSVNASGEVTEHKYDKAKHFATATHYDKPVDISQLTSPDPTLLIPLITPTPGKDRAITQFFDLYGNARFTVDAAGYVIEQRYDLRGLHTATISYMKAISPAILAEWISGKTEPSMPGPTDSTPIAEETHADYLVDTHYYTADGLLALTIDADGWASQIDCDGHNNPIRHIKLSERYMGPRPQGSRPALKYQDDKDIYSFSFYDRRNRKALDVNAEGYVVSYEHNLSNEATTETHHAQAVDINALIASKTHTPPALPASDPEDKTVTRRFDYSGRKITEDSTAGDRSFTSFDEMGNTTASVQYDTTNPSALDGDSLRSHHKVYNAWSQVTAENTPWTEPLLLKILSDASLTPTERHTQITTHWEQHSRRNVYASSGLLLKQFNARNESTENNLGATLFYRDEQDRVTLTIKEEGQVSGKTYNSFNESVEEHALATELDTSTPLYQGLTGGKPTADLQAAIAAIKDDTVDAATQMLYDLRGKNIEKTDPEGYHSDWQFDALKRCIQNRLSKTAAASFDIVHKTEFDPRHNKTLKTIADAGGTHTIATSSTYDHPLAVKTSSSDVRGKELNIERDRCGNTVAETHSGPNADTDTKAYTYDHLNRMLSSKVGDQLPVKHTYSQKDRTHTIKSPGGQIAQLKTSNIFGESVSAQKASLTPMRYTHDQAGKVQVSTNPNGAPKTIARDLEGSIVSLTRTDGIENTWAPDNSGRTIQYIEDTAGRQLKTTIKRNGLNQAVTQVNPRGITTKNTYNRKSLRKTSILDPVLGAAASPTAPLPLQRCTTEEYDGLSKRTHHIKSSLPTTSNPTPKSYATAFGSDVLGRSVSKSKDPETLKLASKNTLDDAGEVVESINEAGESDYYFKNILGKLEYHIDNGGYVTHKLYDKYNRLSMLLQYPTALPSSILTKINAGLSLPDLGKLMADTLGSQIPTEERYFYDANSQIEFVLKVLRTKTVGGSASITQNIRDDAKRIVEKVTYAQYFSWDSEPNWTTDLITVEATALQSTKDQHTDFILDDMGQARYIIDSEGLITEKRYAANKKVWLTIEHNNTFPGALPKSPTVAEIKAIVDGIADPTQDNIEGSFLNNHEKMVYNFKSTDATSVAVRYYGYDEADNVTQLCLFGDPITVVAGYDYKTLLAQCTTLTPDRQSKDRIWDKTYDTDNKVLTCTDEIGSTDIYTRNALGLMETHTDREDNLWQYRYDSAMRCIRTISPVVDVATPIEGKDAKGNLTLLSPTVTSRSIVEATDYNALSQAITKTQDFGTSPSCLNHAAHMTYDSHGEPLSNSSDEVFLDDPTNTHPSAASLPIQKKSTTIKRSTFRDAFKNIVLSEANGRPFTSYIYDNMNRQRYKLIISAFSDTSWSAAVVEYQYNSLNQLDIEIRRATDITSTTAWNPDWFKNIPVPDISDLGVKLTDSTDDRVTYYQRNHKGFPIATYRGVDLEKSDLVKHAIVGLVPLHGPGQVTPTLGYALTEKEYNFSGKIIREKKLIDKAAGLYSDVYRWYSSAGFLLLEATPQQSSVDTAIHYLLARTTYDVFSKKTLTVKLATPYTETITGAELNDLDTFIAANRTDKDRETQYQYDQRGLQIQETKVNVTRSSLTPNPAGDSKPPIITTVKGNSTVLTAHSKTGMEISETRPVFGGATPTTNYKYRDSMGRVVAEVGTPYGTPTSMPAGPNNKTLYPLTQHELDARGNRVLSRNFVNGADLSSLSSALPNPEAPDDANDPVKLANFNKQKQPEVEVDAEGHAVLKTHSIDGQCVRELRAVTQSAGLKVAEKNVVDETRKAFNTRGKLTLKSECRDGTEVESTALAYNAFGEKVGEGPSADKLVLQSKHDQLGNVRISNMTKTTSQNQSKRGVSYVDQVSADSRVTQHIQSAKKDLLTLEITDLAHSIPQDFIPEVNQYFRSPGNGSVIRELYPNTQVTYGRETTELQFQMATQIFGSRYSGSTVTPYWLWPKGNIQNSLFTLKVTLSDKSTKSLSPVDTGSHWAIDTSSLPTGNYPYSIEYTNTDPVTGKQSITYQASGVAPVISTVAATSSVVIPYNYNDSTIGFAGDIADYTHAILTNSQGGVIATLPLSNFSGTTHKHVDCSKLTSAHYYCKLTDGATKQSDPLGEVCINTLQDPTDKDELTSWEIPCGLNIVVSNNNTLLSPQPKLGLVSFWKTLPPSLQNCPIDLDCTYSYKNINWNKNSPTNVPEYLQSTLMVTLSPGANLTANITFDHPVTSIDGINLGLHIDSKNLFPMYTSANPNPTKDLTFTWNNKCFAYLRGENLQGLPVTGATIQIQSPSQDQSETWGEITGFGVASGAVFETTGLYPGHYQIAHQSESPVHSIGTLDVFTSGITSPSNKPKAPLNTSQTIAPEHRYEYDAFNNPIKRLEPDYNDPQQSGPTFFVTTNEYDDRNKIISTTTPPITTYEAGSSDPVQKSGTSYFHFDDFGHSIATQHPMGNQDSYVRDSHGHTLSLIDGTGWHIIDNNLDALGRVASYNRYGHTTQNVHDRRGDIVTQYLPNSDPWRYTSDGPDPSHPPAPPKDNDLVTEHRTYNAYRHVATHSIEGITTKNLITQETFRYQETYHYGRPGNVTLYETPHGYQTTTNWSRGAKVDEQLPVSTFGHQTWSNADEADSRLKDLYSYLGITVSNTDLGGTKTVKVFDFKLQKTQIFNPNPVQNRGQSMSMTPSVVNGYASFNFSPQAQLQQNQKFTYIGGYLMSAEDRSVDGATLYRQTTFKRNVKGLPVYSAFSESNHLLHESWSQYDYAGRESTVVDNSVTQLFVPDLNGNRIREFATRAGTVTDDFWNTYDAADRMLIAHGLFDKVITTDSNQGMKITYTNGLRTKETILKAVGPGQPPVEDDTNYTYWENGSLKHCDRDGQTYDYFFRADYKLVNSATPDGTITNTLDIMGNILNQCTRGNNSSNTIFRYDPCGNILSQWTTQSNAGYTLKYKYYYYASGPVVASVGGTTNDANGSIYTQSQFYYDQNGLIRVKDGTDDGYRIAYVVDPLGHVRQKIHLELDFFFWIFGSDFYVKNISDYSYSAAGNYLGCYNANASDGSIVVGKDLSKSGNTGQSEVLPAAIARISSLAKTDVQTQTNQVENELQHGTPMSQWPDFSWIWRLFNEHKKPDWNKHLFPHGGTGIDDKALYDTVRSLKDSGILGTQTTYVSRPGDTYSSIALAQGDVKQALAIAIANGSSSINDSIPEKTAIRIPSFLSSHNTSDTHTPASELMNLLIGKMSPHLIFAQPKHHWWQALIEIFIAVIVCIVTAGIAIPAAGATIGTVLTAACVGAMTDAALQGLAVGVGLLDHFSLSEVIESAITAGIGKIKTISDILKGALTLKGGAIFKAIAVEMAESLATQLSEMALGVRKHLDFKALIESAVTLIVNAAINNKIPALGTKNGTLFSGIANDIVTSELDALTASAIMGTKFDFFASLEGGLEQFVGDVTKFALQYHSLPPLHAQQTGPANTGGALPNDHGPNAMAADGHIHHYDSGAMKHVDAEAKALRAKHNMTSTEDDTASKQAQRGMSNQAKHSLFNKSQQASSIPHGDWDSHGGMDYLSGDSHWQSYPSGQVDSKTNLDHSTGVPAAQQPNKDNEYAHPIIKGGIIGTNYLLGRGLEAATNGASLGHKIMPMLHIGGAKLALGFISGKLNGKSNAEALNSEVKDTIGSYANHHILKKGAEILVKYGVFGEIEEPLKAAELLDTGLHIVDNFTAPEIPRLKKSLIKRDKLMNSILNNPKIPILHKAAVLNKLILMEGATGVAYGAAKAIHGAVKASDWAGNEAGKLGSAIKKGAISYMHEETQIIKENPRMAYAIPLNPYGMM